MENETTYNSMQSKSLTIGFYVQERVYCWTVTRKKNGKPNQNIFKFSRGPCPGIRGWRQKSIMLKRLVVRNIRTTIPVLSLTSL